MDLLTQFLGPLGFGGRNSRKETELESAEYKLWSDGVIVSGSHMCLKTIRRDSLQLQLPPLSRVP